LQFDLVPEQAQVAAREEAPSWGTQV